MKSKKDTGLTFTEHLLRQIDKIKPVPSAPEVGTGLRISMPMEFETESGDFFVEFYSETVLADVPGEPAIGFTADDLTKFDGVEVMQLIEKMADGEYTRSVGLVYPFKQFLRTLGRKKANMVLKIKLERMMEGLRMMALPNERFFKGLNNAWINRDAGITSINDPIHRC